MFFRHLRHFKCKANSSCSSPRRWVSLPALYPPALSPEPETSSSSLLLLKHFVLSKSCQPPATSPRMSLFLSILSRYPATLNKPLPSPVGLSPSSAQAPHPPPRIVECPLSPSLTPLPLTSTLDLVSPRKPPLPPPRSHEEPRISAANTCDALCLTSMAYLGTVPRASSLVKSSQKCLRALLPWHCL